MAELILEEAAALANTARSVAGLQPAAVAIAHNSSQVRNGVSDPVFCICEKPLHPTPQQLRAHVTCSLPDRDAGRLGGATSSNQRFLCRAVRDVQVHHPPPTGCCGVERQG